MVDSIDEYDLFLDAAPEEYVATGAGRPTEAMHPPEVSRIDGATHYETAVAYVELELPDDAIFEFELAAEDPAWAFPSWRSVGRIQHEQARWDEAAQAYEQALRVAAADEAKAREVTEALDLAKCQTPLPPAVVSKVDDGQDEVIELEPLDDIDLESGSDDSDLDKAFADLFR